MKTKFSCASAQKTRQDFVGNKKGQVWSIDLTIACVIFLIGIIILFLYAINYSSQTKNQLDELIYNGNLASELILSEEDFGILTEDKVDSSKLAEFDCKIRKGEMALKYDFYFSLGGSNYCDIPSNPEDLIKITRITIYDDKPTKFEIFVYD